MEKKTGITFTPWETDEGNKEKRQQSTIPSSFFQRGFESTVTEDSNKSDDMPSHGIKDITSGSVDAQIGTINLFAVPIVCLYVDGKERLCLAQISNTLLRDFSYNEIHNRRVALGITCMQCSPIQLEVLRRSGAMPVSSRRCGLITKREAERLVKSFLEDIPPPKLPENFSFQVQHTCGWGCQGMFMPSRYNSSRAKCIKCTTCNTFFSPNKFIFHYHKTASSAYRHPDAANFNSWRRHLHLVEKCPPETLLFAWEDVKAMFNGGCRKRTSGGKASFSLSPNRTRETTDYKTPVVPTMMRTYQGLQGNNLYRLDMGENMHSAFPVQTGHSSVASYGDMLRSMSLNYSPWWKSLYMQRHGAPSTCNMPYSSDFNIANYGHPQFPLPIIDTTESFMDEMNKLSEMSTGQDKKDRKDDSMSTKLQPVDDEIISSNFSPCDEDNIDIETNDRKIEDELGENDKEKMEIENTDVFSFSDDNIKVEDELEENDKEKMEIKNTDVFSFSDDNIQVEETEKSVEPEKCEKLSDGSIDDNERDDSSEDDLFDDSDLESFSVDKLKEFLLKAKQLRKQKERKRRSQQGMAQSIETTRNSTQD